MWRMTVEADRKIFTQFNEEAERVGRIFQYRITPVEKYRHWSSIICPCDTTATVKMASPV